MICIQYLLIFLLLYKTVKEDKINFISLHSPVTMQTHFSCGQHGLSLSFSRFNQLLLFSHSVVSDSLQPRGPQHARPPCPSPSPRAYSNPCPLSGDAIHPSQPLSSPSPPALHLSQHQGLFQWVSSSHQAAKVLELQLQHRSFHWTFRVAFLLDRWVWSPSSLRDSQESSPTTIRKH